MSGGTPRVRGHAHDVRIEALRQRSRGARAQDCQTDQTRQCLGTSHHFGNQAAPINLSIRAQCSIEIERQVDSRRIADGSESKCGDIPLLAFAEDRSALHVHRFANCAELTLFFRGNDDHRRTVECVDSPRATFQRELERREITGDRYASRPAHVLRSDDIGYAKCFAETACQTRGDAQIRLLAKYALRGSGRRVRSDPGEHCADVDRVDSRFVDRNGTIDPSKRPQSPPRGKL